MEGYEQWRKKVRMRQHTLVHQDRSRTEILVGLYDGLLNSIHENIERLANEPKRGYYVGDVLKVTPWPGVGVNAADGHIISRVEVTVPGRELSTTGQRRTMVKALGSIPPD